MSWSSGGGGGSGSVATDTLWDAAGDLAVGSGADTAAKLTKGSNGTVLTVTAGTVGWGAAGAARTVVTKTTTYTAVTGDIVLASASGGAWALTLPAVTAGATVTVKKTDSSANAVTVTPASGTIDGASTLVINAQYDSFDVVADGTNWWIL